MPTLKSYTFASHTSQPTSQSLQKSMPFQPHGHSTTPDRQTTTERRAACNSGFKKLAVQWLIEHLCFVSSSVVADSFVLRNRQLLKPANRWATYTKLNRYDLNIL
ncbi:MAG: hypothetical protein V9E90_09170 [Saprospiraceae bacterium]